MIFGLGASKRADDARLLRCGFHMLQLHLGLVHSRSLRNITHFIAHHLSPYNNSQKWYGAKFSRGGLMLTFQTGCTELRWYPDAARCTFNQSYNSTVVAPFNHMAISTLRKRGNCGNALATRPPLGGWVRRDGRNKELISVLGRA